MSKFNVFKFWKIIDLAVKVYDMIRQATKKNPEPKESGRTLIKTKVDPSQKGDAK